MRNCKVYTWLVCLVSARERGGVPEAMRLFLPHTATYMGRGGHWLRSSFLWRDRAVFHHHRIAPSPSLATALIDRQHCASVWTWGSWCANGHIPYTAITSPITPSSCPMSLFLGGHHMISSLVLFYNYIRGTHFLAYAHMDHPRGPLLPPPPPFLSRRDTYV